ncbi:MAG: alcohol dehydrogenase catalytic domain-containing protein [Planctomycetota bacterium]
MLLRLRVCGLCGTDLFKLAVDSAPVGSVLGHEIVGDVVAGEGAKDADGRTFEVGERVVVPHHVACGNCDACVRGSETMCDTFRANLLDPGGFSEFVRVEHRAVTAAARRVPDGIEDAAAVFLEPAACVVRSVERAQLRPDDSCVIFGAGSMGLLHLLVLRAMNLCERIAVIDPMPERRALALELGATSAASPNGAGDLRATGGFHASFDTVGGAKMIDSALAVTLPGAAIVLFAHAPDGDVGSFDLNAFFKTERRLVATYSGSLREQQTTYDLIVSGQLDASPLVTGSLGLDRFDEAVERVRSHRDLKVLLQVGDS